MSMKAKNYLKRNAWNFFPSQELWINDQDHFWSFEKDNNNLILTQGEFLNDSINYQTHTRQTQDPDSELNEMINEKINTGYECFAIELRS